MGLIFWKNPRKVTGKQAVFLAKSLYAAHISRVHLHLAPPHRISEVNQWFLLVTSRGHTYLAGQNTRIHGRFQQSAPRWQDDTPEAHRTWGAKAKISVAASFSLRNCCCWGDLQGDCDSVGFFSNPAKCPPSLELSNKSYPSSNQFNSDDSTKSCKDC